MSGGTFGSLSNIEDIVRHIEGVVKNNGRAYTREEKMCNMGEAWYGEYPEDAFFPKYSPRIIGKFKKGIKLLKEAQVYAQRVDYLLAGDDGEESFLRRLETELNQLKTK